MLIIESKKLKTENRNDFSNFLYLKNYIKLQLEFLPTKKQTKNNNKNVSFGEERNRIINTQNIDIFNLILLNMKSC